MYVLKNVNFEVQVLLIHYTTIRTVSQKLETRVQEHIKSRTCHHLKLFNEDAS